MTDSTTTDANPRRLGHLLEIARGLRDQGKPFDMGRFFGDPARPRDCGTPACLAGWACRDASFVGQGLDISGDGMFPTYKRYDSYEALEKFFGLHRTYICHIFDPENYYYELPSIDNVIRRLCAIVAKHHGACAGSQEGT